MTSFFRIVRLFAVVAWIGGLFFFVVVVTRLAFNVLPDAHTAGAMVRGTLLSLHRIGFGAGIAYIVATLALIGTQRDSHIARAVEVLLVIVMLLVTAYSHFSVLPRMESDLLSLGGDVNPSNSNTAAHKHFERLHKLSVKMEGTVLIGGLLLICLAPLPHRDDLDRPRF